MCVLILGITHIFDSLKNEFSLFTFFSSPLMRGMIGRILINGSRLNLLRYQLCVQNQHTIGRRDSSGLQTLFVNFKLLF